MSPALNQEQITAIVREAVREELRGANLIDGPTHIAHHQALAEMLKMAGHAKRTLVGALVKGAMALMLLGLLAWVWGNRAGQ